MAILDRTRCVPERYARDGHDDHGRADAPGSNLGNGGFQ